MKERTIKYLEGLANGTVEPADTSQGLRHSLEQEELRILRLNQIFEIWDKFSGDITYPVPDPTRQLDACTKCHNTSNLWEGEYGKLRKELCQFIADYIKENGFRCVKDVMEERIIEHLEGLAGGTVEPYDIEQGLCTSLEERGLKIPELSQIFDLWDKCSGDTVYPVPDPAGELGACTKYHNASDMWKGEYGELRKELCQYIADYIKENGLPEQGVA